MRQRTLHGSRAVTAASGRESGSARRLVLRGGAALLGGVLSASLASAATEAVDVLRVRAEGIDALLERARKAHDAGRMTRDAYIAMLQVLRDEEQDVHAAAAARVYDNEGASNYWHRGRLKFPTLTQQELERISRQP
jgi:hypothetical protein